MSRGSSVFRLVSRPRLAHMLAVGAVFAVLSVLHLGLLADGSPLVGSAEQPASRWWRQDYFSTGTPKKAPTHGKFEAHGQEWDWKGASSDMYNGYNGDGHNYAYWNAHDDGPCAGWDRHGLRKDDPPGCLRAKQWRELQDYRAMDGSGAMQKGLHETNQYAMDRVERCVLGFLDCPERPLIVSNFGYMNIRLVTSGEAIWLYPVMKSAEEMGFSFITTQHEDREHAWNITRLLPSLVHSLWQSPEDTFLCQTNPLCVRQEDYIPAEEEKYRHDVSLIPKERLGNLAPWRMISISYWGDRPPGYGAPGINSDPQWGIKHGNFSTHILGNKFHFTPFAYPGHTHIPLSVEQRCLRAEHVPYDERNASALVLAKRNRLFHDEHNKPIHKAWGNIVNGLKEINYDLLAVANMEDKDPADQEKYPIPPELNNLRELSSEGYSKLVANQRALLGIGKPEISPSPYIAVCLGVPVVMPYYTDLGATPDGPDKWELFSFDHVQHGPFNTLGEPYVYAYNMSDPADLVAKLKKAVQTPIKPYIPEDMRMESLRRRVHAALFETDWEAEYDARVAENGGVTPKFPAYMMDHCHRMGFCQNAPIIGKKAGAFNLFPRPEQE